MSFAFWIPPETLFRKIKALLLRRKKEGENVETAHSKCALLFRLWDDPRRGSPPPVPHADLPLKYMAGVLGKYAEVT